MLYRNYSRQGFLSVAALVQKGFLFRVFLNLSLALVLMACFLIPSNAAIINVSAKPGEAGCSLVEAIISANSDTAFGGCTAGSGADVVQFSGVHTYQAPVPLDFELPWGAAALPQITSVITIRGITPNSIIERDTTSTYMFRVLNVRDGDLTLENLTIRGGDVSISNPAHINANRGAGVLVTRSSDGVSSLTTLNTQFTNNRAVWGGGINVSIANHVAILSSLIKNNSASFGAAGLFSNVGSAVIIEDTMVEENVPVVFGNSTLEFFNSDLEMKRSAVVSNRSTAAIQVGTGSLSIFDSTISGNFNPETNSSQGINIFPTVNARFTLINSTIVNNKTNSSVTGTTPTAYGVWLRVPESEVFDGLFESVIVRNSIISGNASGSRLVGSIPFLGGEVVLLDLDNRSGPTSFEFINNVIGDSSTLTEQAIQKVSIDSTTNQILTSDSESPLPLSSIVNPLGDYGGPTKSHTLPPNSPARNAGTGGYFFFVGPLAFFAPGCRGELVSSTIPPYRVDQRGLSRPIGGACDVGSTEFRSADEQDSCYVIKATNDKLAVVCL